MLTIRFGDITGAQSEVIVSSDDIYISMGGGVSASILRAGGQEIIIDASKKVPAQIGDVVVTAAGRLPSKYVFHAITLDREHEILPETVLRKTVSKCFDLMEALGLQSVSFPAIGAGAAGFDYEVVAVEMANIIARRLLRSSVALDVTLFLYDRFGQMQPIDFLRFFEEFRAKMSEFAVQEVPAELHTSEVTKAVQKPAGLALHRQAVLIEIKDIEEKRTRLEEQLARLVDSDDQANQKIGREGLLELQEKRLRLLAELQRAPNSKVRIFISYAHEDVEYLKDLTKQLAILKRGRVVEQWHDRKILAGTEWRGKIDEELNFAHVVLLLVSSDFIYSNYSYDVEVKRALERHNAGDACVIPVILRPCMWSSAPFAELQALPAEGKPISTWPDRDAAFLNVAEGIRAVVESITAKSHSAKA